MPREAAEIKRRMTLRQFCNFNLLKYEMSLETHPLYCLTHETNLAGVQVSVKIVSYDILCLIDYLVKNLRKSIMPSQLWISNLMM